MEIAILREVALARAGRAPSSGADMSIRSGRSVQRASDVTVSPLTAKHYLLSTPISIWVSSSRQILSGRFTREKLFQKGQKKAGLLKWMARELPSSVAMKLYLCYVRPSLE